MDNKQQTDQWFADRLGLPTSSNYAAVLSKGTTRRNYMVKLAIEVLTGQKEESYTNATMQHGIDTEAPARLAYEFETGNTVEEVGFIRHDTLDTGASPDGLIGKDGLVEIKCPSSAVHIDYLFKGTLPSTYRAQVQGQMWITDRQWCDFVSYDDRLPENAQISIVRVNRDVDYIANLEIEINKFIAELNDLVEKLRGW